MSDELGLDDALIIPGHVLLRRVEDEMILLNLDSDEYFAVDEIAARFLETLEPSGTVHAAANSLIAEYDVELDTVTSDLLGLSKELVAAGLLALAP